MRNILGVLTSAISLRRSTRGGPDVFRLCSAGARTAAPCRGKRACAWPGACSFSRSAVSAICGHPPTCRTARGAYSPLSIAAGDVPENLAAVLPELCGRYIEHRFDLLGSGWVKVAYGMTAAGLEGHRLSAASRPRIADRDGNWLARTVTRSKFDGSAPPLAPRPRPLCSDRLADRFQIGLPLGWPASPSRFSLATGPASTSRRLGNWRAFSIFRSLPTAHLLAMAGRPGFAEPAFTRGNSQSDPRFSGGQSAAFRGQLAVPDGCRIRAANMVVGG